MRRRILISGFAFGKRWRLVGRGSKYGYAEAVVEVSTDKDAMGSPIWLSPDAEWMQHFPRCVAEALVVREKRRKR